MGVFAQMKELQQLSVWRRLFEWQKVSYGWNLFDFHLHCQGVAARYRGVVGRRVVGVYHHFGQVACGIIAWREWGICLRNLTLV